MGRFTDAASMGFPFRPTFGSFATLFWEFDPRTQASTDFDMPLSPDFEIKHWNDSANSMSRIDLTPTAAMPFQRIWGVVGSISESSGAENTTTGFKFEIIAKFPYRIEGFGPSEAERSWFFARIAAFSSNALLCDAAELHLGSTITGVVSANYSGCGRAQLDSWSIVNCFTRPRILLSLFSFHMGSEHFRRMEGFFTGYRFYTVGFDVF